jgi:hypothetical protein
VFLDAMMVHPSLRSAAAATPPLCDERGAVVISGRQDGTTGLISSGAPTHRAPLL